MTLITRDPGTAGIMPVAPVLFKFVWQQCGVFTKITGVHLSSMLALVMFGEIGIPVGLEGALVTHVLEALAPLLELVVLVGIKGTYFTRNSYILSYDKESHKKIFFSGRATKALPLKLSGHIFSDFFLSFQKSFLSGPAFTHRPPPL